MHPEQPCQPCMYYLWERKYVESFKESVVTVHRQKQYFNTTKEIPGPLWPAIIKTRASFGLQVRICTDQVHVIHLGGGGLIHAQTFCFFAGKPETIIIFDYLAVPWTNFVHGMPVMGNRILNSVLTCTPHAQRMYGMCKSRARGKQLAKLYTLY